MFKKTALFLTGLIFIALFLCACGGKAGVYVLESDDAYSIEVKDDSHFAVHWGSNMFSGTYEKNEDDQYHFTNSSDFTSVDMTGVFEGNNLLLTGDIILKNLDGSVSDHSLLGMENVCFKK